MSMSALSKQKAANLTRTAQIALALLVVGAGSALAVSWRSSGKDVDVPGPLEVPVADLGLRKSTAQAHDLDHSSVADRLGAVANHPKPVQAAAAPNTGALAPASTSPADIRYLGAVGLGATKMALVSEGGKQKFVGEGDSFAGGTVERITDTEVRIGGSASKTLSLASRSAEVLTRAGRNAPGSVVNPPGVRPANPNLANGLQAYTPPTPQEVMGKPMTQDELNYRARLDIPDYVAPGEEHDFVAVREDIRNTEKFTSEEELNELASKRWEEKRGSSPEVQQYLKERDAARKLEEAGRKPGEPQ
jgi:hypothetical protein